MNRVIPSPLLSLLTFLGMKWFKRPHSSLCPGFQAWGGAHPPDPPGGGLPVPRLQQEGRRPGQDRQGAHCKTGDKLRKPTFAGWTKPLCNQEELADEDVEVTSTVQQAVAHFTSNLNKVSKRRLE